MRAGRDEGSAAVWALALLLVPVCVGVGLLGTADAVAARHRAAGVADLAALAAADGLRDGAGEAGACERARRVARAQEAGVVRCVLPGGGFVDVEVEVRVDGVARAFLGGTAAARVVSRAGPG